MTTKSDVIGSSHSADKNKIGSVIGRVGVILAFFIVCLFFTIASPTFRTPINAVNILAQSVILLIVTMAMTLVITSGGIDLSVGISLDFGALAAVTLLQNNYTWWTAILGGLLLGSLVGVVNAVLIVRLGISPFLATLGVSFIGLSLQQIYTNGNEPIYLAKMDPIFRSLGIYKLFDVLSVRVLFAAVLVVIVYLLIERTVHGKRWRATGSQFEAARIAGIRVNQYSASSYIIGSLICAFAGIILSAVLSSYVPNSGGSYLLDAIGATFIGTSLDREGRPNVLGSLLGVIFLGVVANGLNLIGLNFYWQAVARGVLIFVALLLGALNQRKHS